VLKEEDFHKVLQKVQIVDVIERTSFEYSHFLDGRKFLMSRFKDIMTSLLKEKPVYIYENHDVLTKLAAILFHKAGFKELSFLKKVFSMDGKEKIKKINIMF
jgi:rhodanese-related sulfurtransferase